MKNTLDYISDISGLFFTNKKKFLQLLITGADYGRLDYISYINTINIYNILQNLVFTSIEIEPLIKQSNLPNHPFSKWFIGFLHLIGIYGLPIDYKKGFDLCNESINDGYSGAYITLGYIYNKGLGVEINYEKAVNFYKIAHKAGNFIATGMLANYYMSPPSTSFKQNYEKAVSLLEMAMQAGNPFAITTLARMYYSGIYFQPSYIKAFELYKIAQEVDDLMSIYMIGRMYLHGNGVLKDYKKAIKLLEIANNRGILYAAGELGHAYFYGKGVEQDYGKALELFIRSMDPDCFKFIHVIIDKIFKDGVEINVSVELLKKMNLDIIYEKHDVPEVLKRLQTIDIVCI